MKLAPFRACIYGEDLKELTAPPFDGITPEQEKELKKNPYNITHLTLPHGPAGVETAKNKIEQWIKDGVLMEVPEDTLFVLVQNFRLNKENIERIGIIGVTELYPDDGTIMPHEKTFPGPVKNRAELMRGLEAQLEPLFLTVLNNNFDRVVRRTIAGSRPDRVFEEPMGVNNELYLITDPEKISKISGVIEGDNAIVADGHHRLKAARSIAESTEGDEKKFWSRSMVYVSSIYERGLLISGMHRIVNGGYSLKQNRDRLNSYFEVREKKNLDTLNSIVIYDGEFKEIRPRKAALEMLFGDDYKPEEILESSVLNEILFSKVLDMQPHDLEYSVQYTHDVSLAVGYVDSGKSDFAAIMPPWNKDAFIKKAMNGGVMPQKSTYFYPKIPSGVAIRKFDKSNC